MVDYSFYENDYLGSAIPDREFSGMAAQAQAVLSRFRRMYRVESPGPDGEKMAICAMAETLYARSQRNSGVSAATIGSVSVRYDQSGDGSRALMAELYEQASIYLDIYRGVRNE